MWFGGRQQMGISCFHVKTGDVCASTPWIVLCPLQGITLVSSQAVSNAKKMGWPLKEVTSGVFEAEAPGGYKFYLEDKEQLKQGEIFTLTLPGVQEDLPVGCQSGLCVYFGGIL